MAETTSRFNVVSQVSTWLQLLTVVVLVGEATLTYAMYQTPSNDARYILYPILMSLLLFSIIGGFFLEKILESRKKELSVPIGSKTVVTTQEQKEPIPEAQLSRLGDSTYRDSKLGFQFELPKSAGWQPIKSVFPHEILIQKGILPKEDVEEFLKLRAMAPLGKMLAAGSALWLTYGQPVRAKITKETTTAAFEEILARAEIDEAGRAELRSQALLQMPEAWDLQNEFSIVVTEKSLAENDIVKPTLPALLATIILEDIKINIDNIVADDRAIVFTSSNHYKNVNILGKKSDLDTYMLIRLTESKNRIYQLQIFFSPQAGQSMHVWDDLRRMADSFRMLEV